MVLAPFYKSFTTSPATGPH